MPRRARLILVVAWIVSLVGVGAWAGGQVSPRIIPAPRAVPPSPMVIAGWDLGFRVDSEGGGVKRGTLVIRVDGAWVEVQFSTKVSPVR